MAYDKVVDSAELDAGLKKVADAIRDKTGNTDELAFPDGMASELTSATGAMLFRQNMIEYCRKQGYELRTIKDGTTTLKNQGYHEYRRYWATMPNSVTEIANGDYGCFVGCKNTLFDKLSDNLVTIGTAAFNNCTNLTLTSLPDGLTSIGTDAFNNCSNLPLTSLPPALTTIGNSAFNNCTNLSLESLPPALTTIGNYAFYYCNYLQVTEIPASVQTIGASAFYKAFNSSSVAGYKGVLTFRGTPKSIGANTFGYNGSLKTINVPWSEGEVANAPWGFSGTINYNYKGE